MALTNVSRRPFTRLFCGGMLDWLGKIGAGVAVGAKHIIVHGDVQGVGFRYFAQRAAVRLGLAGNVRNCPDSTVEIVAQGESSRVAEFISEVRKGPRSGRVDRLEIEDIPVSAKCRAFLIEGW